MATKKSTEETTEETVATVSEEVEETTTEEAVAVSDEATTEDTAEATTEEAEAETETETEAETETETEVIRNYIYIGPSLPRGLLKCNTLFKSTRTDLETYLAAQEEKFPGVLDLIVTTDKLAEARYSLKQKKGLLYSRYNQVQKEIVKFVRGGK